jgi:hypothetical protein
MVFAAQKTGADMNRCGLKQMWVKTHTCLLIINFIYLLRNKKQGGVYIGAGLNPHLFVDHQFYLSLTQKKTGWGLCRCGFKPAPI